MVSTENQTFLGFDLSTQKVSAIAYCSYVCVCWPRRKNIVLLCSVSWAGGRRRACASWYISTLIQKPAGICSDMMSVSDVWSISRCHRATCSGILFQLHCLPTMTIGLLCGHMTNGFAHINVMQVHYNLNAPLWFVILVVWRGVFDVRVQSVRSFVCIVHIRHGMFYDNNLHTRNNMAW